MTYCRDEKDRGWVIGEVSAVMAEQPDIEY